jgi:hypothetical protein
MSPFLPSCTTKSLYRAFRTAEKPGTSGHKYAVIPSSCSIGSRVWFMVGPRGKQGISLLFFQDPNNKKMKRETGNCAVSSKRPPVLRLFSAVYRSFQCRMNCGWCDRSIANDKPKHHSTMMNNTSVTLYKKQQWTKKIPCTMKQSIESLCCGGQMTPNQLIRRPDRMALFPPRLATALRAKARM